MTNKSKLSNFLQRLESNYPHSPQFIQAVEEVGRDVSDFIKSENNDTYWKVFELLTEPDRIIQFRVDWEDDDGNFHINRGYRVQFNNTLGPYKGGLRFTNSTAVDELLFLGFEQTFKNALTGLPMGGAKGGADFDPREKSESEIRRFCQAFMTQLSHHIGPDKDIPAGDIGVGTREIGYMFQQYKVMSNQFRGILTGKDPVFGGSCIREEATGYGCVYFASHMMKHIDKDLKDMRCAVSGAGNVAVFTAKKLIELGAKVISLSNSKGTCYFKNGVTEKQLNAIIDARQNRQRIEDIDSLTQYFEEGKKPWSFDADIAFPCATQNELDEEDAKKLVSNGYIAVVEGANMPCSNEAIKVLDDNEVIMGPSKAVNAGGVAVSGLEISQNRSRLSWDASKVDDMLKDIMSSIHDTCVEYGGKNDLVHYRKGANIAAFKKLSHALQYSGMLL